MSREELSGLSLRTLTNELRRIHRRVPDGKLSVDEVLAVLGEVAGYDDESIFERYRRLIDCDKEPMDVPKGWGVHSHKRSGLLEFSPKWIALYVAPMQWEKERVTGEEWLKGLEGKRALNSCVLDHLEVHPELLPACWADENPFGEEHNIYFPGTIFRDMYGSLRIRCLVPGDHGGWQSDDKSLDDVWGRNDCAAVLAG